MTSLYFLNVYVIWKYKNIAKIWFENVNDKTCEGIEYINFPIISSQFHPDNCDNPHGTGFLFGRFIENMEKRRNK